MQTKAGYKATIAIALNVKKVRRGARRVNSLFLPPPSITFRCKFESVSKLTTEDTE